MAEQVLSNQELALEYAPRKWGDYYPAIQEVPEAQWPAIFKSWLAEKQAGRDRGRPLGPEQPLPSGGILQEFERGDALYRDGRVGWAG